MRPSSPLGERQPANGALGKTTALDFEMGWFFDGNGACKLLVILDWILLSRVVPKSFTLRP